MLFAALWEFLLFHFFFDKSQTFLSYMTHKYFFIMFFMMCAHSHFPQKGGCEDFHELEGFSIRMRKTSIGSMHVMSPKNLFREQEFINYKLYFSFSFFLTHDGMLFSCFFILSFLLGGARGTSYHGKCCKFISMSTAWWKFS